MKHQANDLQRKVYQAVRAWYDEVKTHPKDHTAASPNEAFIRTVGASVYITSLHENWGVPREVVVLLAQYEAKHYLAWLGTAATPRKS